MLWLRYCRVQMVNSENINDKMVKCTIWCLAVLFTLLEVFVRTQISVRDTTHGFIQSNNEVRYLVDDISTIHKEFSPGIRNSKLHDARMNSFLRFEPEFLDFKERPLGVPHLEKVTLFNINSNKSLDMTSISGNTVHFHSSFFEDKKIPPLGNTTFNVVFLGREEGQIESSLFIHTTEGSYKYQVRGASVASSYRLRPIVDIRVPLNASFSPLIYMHNPHTQPIQIVEVYSSGGEFHLELPTGELEGPKGMWEIPPFQTKPIIRVRFNARSESNYTAYVRIKVNGIKDVLVVPLEVEVSAQCGLHTPQGTVDFGVGGTLDKPKQVKLLVYNTLKKPIRIQSVSASTKAVRVDFQPLKVLPESKEPVEIASLHLDWKSAFETKDFFGKIIIKYKQGKSELEIPYWATVFEGGLYYNASVTKYLTDKGSVDYGSRNFTVVNMYEYPLAVTNVSLPTEAQLYFSIKKFKPHILQPSESAVLFELTLKSEAVSSDLKLKSFFMIHTNISSVEVPLLSYNGKLTMVLPGTSNTAHSTFDLGLVGCDSTKEAHFTLLNSNPVDVKLLHIGSHIESGSVHLVGCASDNYANHIHFPPVNMSRCTYLRPGEYAVFKVSVQTTKSEGQVFVQTFVQTQFEKIVMPVRFKVAQGKLEIGPDRLVFDECFPGKICSHPLRIHSTFTDPMVIQSISSIPPDPRLSSSHSGHITARSTKIIGHLFLDPVLGCRNHCYTGLSLNSSIGTQWLKTFALPATTCDLDINLLNIFYGRYLNLTSSGKKWQNLTLRLDTSEVKGHFFHTRVKMSWPKLVIGSAAAALNKSVFTFPLTQIGNTSYKNITIRNPSNAILTLQLVMDWAYPQAKNLFKNIPTSFIPGQEETFDSHAFFFHDLHATNRTQFSDFHNVHVHQHTVPITIPARETVHVTVGFRATVSTLKSAFMYVRNNLTVLEVVRLTGQGAHPSFKFGNRKPASTMPLLFELTEKHLKDCEKEKNRKNPSPNLTVKRSFTARNTGDIPITINAFYINGFPCEGYGFKVLNCAPFELSPNATRKIDIAFTPDFTLSKIQRTLLLETSLNVPVNYTLVTTLPPYFLAPCASVLARPNWEPFLYYACVALMTFLLFIVLSVCFIESDRILRMSLNIRDETDTQPLDLRLIGMQTRNEIRSHKCEPDGDWSAHVANGGLANGASSSGSNVAATTTAAASSSGGKCKDSVAVAVVRQSEAGKLNWPADASCKDAGSGRYDEKYSPPVQSASAKGKKRVSKKNSVEAAEQLTSDALVQKKSWTGVFSRGVPASSKNRLSMEPSEDKKSPVVVAAAAAATPKQECMKKPVLPVQKEQPKKQTQSKKSKVLDLPCSEEETSSTTTESSNNEELEKFTDTQLKPDKPKKTQQKCKNKSPTSGTSSSDFRDNYEGDGEEEDFDKESCVVVVATSSSRWKPRSENKCSRGGCSAGSAGADVHEHIKHSEASRTQENCTSVVGAGSGSGGGGGSRKNNKNSQRERKEKGAQKRRQEKHANKNSTNSESNSSHSSVNNVRVSPPMPPIGVWGENRATFSDVVARSDTSLYSQPMPAVASAAATTTTTTTPRSATHTAKPTLYVEPTQKQKEPKLSSAELGPIGSKKSDMLWPETNNRPSYSAQQAGALKPLQLSNSFFTEPQHPLPPVESQGSPYFDMPDIWSNQESSMHLFQNNLKESSQEVPSLSPFQENWNYAGSWEPLCAPVGENRPQQSLASDYFWSAPLPPPPPPPVTSVWPMSPWPTLVSPADTLCDTPPIRSPPGFNRDEDDAQRRQGFDPFSSLSNIWTPHSPDAWTYNPHNGNQ